jgi:hypothetical protein
MRSCRHSIENTFAPRLHTLLGFDGKYRQKRDADSRGLPFLVVMARGSHLAWCCAVYCTPQGVLGAIH